MTPVLQPMDQGIFTDVFLFKTYLQGHILVHLVYLLVHIENKKSMFLKQHEWLTKRGLKWTKQQ